MACWNPNTLHVSFNCCADKSRKSSQMHAFKAFFLFRKCGIAPKTFFGIFIFIQFLQTPLCLYNSSYIKTPTFPCHSFMCRTVNKKPEAVHAVKLGCHWNDPVNLCKIRLGNSLSHCEKVTGLIHISYCISPVKKNCHWSSFHGL